MLIMRTTPAAKSSGRRRRNPARHRVGALLVVLAMTTGGGCLPQIIRSTAQPYQNLVFLQTLKWRAAIEARQVWGERLEANYANHACRNDVKDGFVTAYVETALGSDGCPPPVPRTSTFYRTIGHRTPAPIPWYEGYDLGHAIAVANGVDRWRLLPIDPDLEAGACRPVCLPASDVPLEGPATDAPPIHGPEIIEPLDADAEVFPDPDRPTYAEPIPPAREVETLPSDAAVPNPDLLEL
jgi:hypothetical protein